MTTPLEVLTEQLSKVKLRKLAKQYYSFDDEFHGVLNDFAGNYQTLYSFRSSSVSLTDHIKAQVELSKTCYPHPIPKEKPMIDGWKKTPAQQEYISLMFSFIDSVNIYLEAKQYNEKMLMTIKEVLDTFCYGKFLNS